jgi:glycosyltransferase
LVFHFHYNQNRSLAKGLKEFFSCKTVATVHYLRWAQELQGNFSKLQVLKAKPEKERTDFEELLCTTDEYEGALFREVDRVISLSENMKKLLCSEYRLDSEKIPVISNGLADTYPVSVADKSALRRKWFLSENELLILFVGRLHPIKGLFPLIRSFRKVLEVMPNCRLMIAGSGLYDFYIQEAKEICTKVTFTGLLDRQVLAELYQIADVGVMPSLYEPFGYVAVEMMMHGLPIVATATSGLNEVVDDTCGLKIPVIEQPDSIDIDMDLLAEKIICLLQNPDKAKEMGQNGRKRYLKKYTSDVFRRNMLLFYESLYK